MLTQWKKSESFQCQLTLVIFWIKLGAASKASKPISSILSSPSFWYLVQVTLKTSKLDWQLPWSLPFWLCQPSLARLNHNWPAGGTNNAASAELWLSFRITIDNGTARLRHIRIVCPRVLMSFQDYVIWFNIQYILWNWWHKCCEWLYHHWYSTFCNGYVMEYDLHMTWLFITCIWFWGKAVVQHAGT